MYYIRFKNSAHTVKGNAHTFQNDAQIITGKPTDRPFAGGIYITDNVSPVYVELTKQVLQSVNHLVPADSLAVWVYNLQKDGYPEDSDFEKSLSPCFWADQPGRYTIEICDDVIYLNEKIWEQSFDTVFGYRLINFFEGLDVPVTPQSVFVNLLLHEIGHIFMISRLFYQAKAMPVYRAWNSMSQVPTEFLSSLLQDGEDSLSDKGIYDSLKHWENLRIDMGQFINGEEAQADIFAMQHFYPIWKKCKNLGIV